VLISAASVRSETLWPTLEEASEFDKTLDVEPLIKNSEE
jgi:hypothetical protein